LDANIQENLSFETGEAWMPNFINLHEIVQQFQTDPATQNDPVKRMFICDGEAVTANIATSSGDDSKLHTQPNHDEIVIVIDGEAEFMVGDETCRVGPGDFIFIPRKITKSMSALSIYAPHFDKAKNNIIWHKGA
jgi:quercetin dioxygenase-like cupin family protein